MGFENLLTQFEVARECGVSVVTVARWAKHKKLCPIRSFPFGEERANWQLHFYRRIDVRRWKRRMGSECRPGRPRKQTLASAL